MHNSNESTLIPRIPIIVIALVRVIATINTCQSRVTSIVLSSQSTQSHDTMLITRLSVTMWPRNKTNL